MSGRGIKKFIRLLKYMLKENRVGVGREGGLSLYKEESVGHKNPVPKFSLNNGVCTL